MNSKHSRRKILCGAGTLSLLGLAGVQAQPNAPPSGMGLLEKSARRQVSDEQLKAVDDDIKAQTWVLDDFVKADYSATPIGKFINVDKLFLRWAKPDWFEYIPASQAPISFVRSTGETVTPGQMFTDGGSIPRWFWMHKNLSPWVYVPAYLIHDWEFDQHHLKKTDKSFDAVRDTIAEGLKTLMETGLCPRDETTFRTIYAGVSSFVAKKIWNT
jgi:hypothetical protein